MIVKLEGGHSSQAVQEAGRQAAERAVLTVGDGFGAVPDQVHEKWYQRRSGQQYEPGQEICWEDKYQDGQWYQGGKHQLGQVLAEIRIQAFHPLNDSGGQFTASFPFQIAWSQIGDLFKQQVPDPAFDLDRNGLGAEAAQPG